MGGYGYPGVPPPCLIFLLIVIFDLLSCWLIPSANITK